VAGAISEVVPWKRRWEHHAAGIAGAWAGLADPLVFDIAMDNSPYI